MKYFKNVVDFVQEHFIFIIVAFFIALAVETIIIWRKCKKYGDDYDTNKLYVLIISDLLAIIALFVASCLVVGFVNCVKDQDYHFFRNYVAFMDTGFFKTVSIGLAGISAVIMFFRILSKSESWVGALLGGLGSGLLAYIAVLIVGFVLYVVVSFLIIILKLIWFVISGFFVSLVTICSSRALELGICIFVPGIIYGCVCVIKNYIISLKEEVFDK